MIEPMDIYEANKELTGQCVERAGSFMHENQYLLYVLAIVQTVEGKYLVTQRALDKHWAAGWWEITGGGVRAGETSLEAVMREVIEETGLYPENCEPELVYTYRNDDPDGGDNYFVDMYRFVLDFDENDVELQQSEAIDFQLLSWDDIVALHDEGIFLHFHRVRRALGK